MGVFFLLLDILNSCPSEALAFVMLERLASKVIIISLKDVDIIILFNKTKLPFIAIGIRLFAFTY